MEKRRTGSYDPYARSRLMYIIEAMFENFITVVTTGAYLAKLTTSIGISDGLTAILATITSLSSVFQIISISLAHRNPIKPIIIPIQVLSHLMLAGLYLIPLIGFNSGAVAIFCIITILARACSSITSPLKVNWFMSLVDPKKRGSYTANLQIVSIVGQIIFALAASNMVDRFDEQGNLRGAFIALTVTILVLTVLTNLPLFLAREKHEVSERKPSPFHSVKELCRNKKYVRAISIFAIYSVAANVGASFLGTYQIKELGFSMTFIAILDTIISVLHIAALAVLGRLSFHMQYRSVVRLGYLLSIGAYTALIFTTTSTGAVLFLVYRVFNMLYSSSMAVSQRNLLFEICPPEERTSAISIFTMTSGLIGFAATVAVTPLFNHMQATGVTVFGIDVFPQQVFAAVALVLVIIVNVLWNISYNKLESDEEY